MSRQGRGDAPPPRPSRPPRQGRLDYPPKVAVSLTQGAQKVSGLQGGRAANVTGNEPGSLLPISGTQYIGTESAAGWCPASPKVGHARTPGGRVVSGTLVRSRVAVTGDEAGGGVRITGEADQQPEDDLGPSRQAPFVGLAHFRSGSAGSAGAQRPAFANREPLRAGSRERERALSHESTENGLPITGSAIGRSVRVTGDEAGACRQLTGDQYLAPARLQSECGGRGGGTGMAAPPRGRADPVSGAKVSLGRTWGGQQVSGSDFEHDRRVTGEEPGTCAVLTGTPYQGAATMHAWCDPQQVGAADTRLSRRQACSAVTGDVPLVGGGVSGNTRGKDRVLTGTPYAGSVADAQPEPAEDRPGGTRGFSVRALMFANSRRDAADPAAAEPERITGAFAVGQGKITGNLEFLFRARSADDPAARPGHARLTGEGSSSGRRITGDAWAEHRRVTGTEGSWAAGRSPSERAGQPHAFAGARRFEPLGKHDEPRQIVTGMVGWSSKSAAKVTLSGGAQG